jgi:hypothetical protein
MKTYHLAFLDTIETSARITYFNPKTIYYIGKLTVNKKTDEIIYQCVNEKECEKLKITASYYLGRDEDGLTLPIGYSLFSLNKPKKQKRTDYIEYLPFDKLWLLGR